jgi:hypothetical protein
MHSGLDLIGMDSMLITSALFRPRAVYAVIATAVVAATLAVAAPANAQLSFSSFATQGDATAGWVNEPNAPPNATEQQSISLFVNGKSANDFSAAARARFVGINGPAPATPPNFDFKVFTVGGSGGSVRLVVRFADGGRIELRPVSLSANVWTHIDGSGNDWDSVGGACSAQVNSSYSNAVACHPGANVTGVDLINDSGWLYLGGFQVLADNVSYGETTVSVPPPPVLGESFSIARKSGDVFVRYPGRRRKGQVVHLQGSSPFPVDSIIDSRKGRVRLDSSRGSGGRHRGVFRSGIFKVKQPKKKGGVTSLVLRGGLFGCTAKTATAGKAHASVLSRRRRLWGRGRGRFRTRGLYSSGSVRGTIWLTQDTCEGTRTVVVRGVVDVTDLTTGETHSITAGHSYFASRGN